MTSRTAHVGHRMILRTADLLWCHDCRIVVSLATEDRTPPRPDDPGRCLRHAGEWAGSCRACRADTLADETRERVVVPLSDVARAHLRNVRAVLAGQPTTTEETADA